VQSAAYGEQNVSSCWSRPSTSFLNTVSCEKRPSCVARTPEHRATVSGSEPWRCVYLCVWIVCTCSTNSDDVLSLRHADGMSLVKHSICFLLILHVPCVVSHSVQCTYQGTIQQIATYQVPTTTCFGTKVPSTGSVSTTKVRRSNT
jgi:hypothetical protein